MSNPTPSERYTTNAKCELITHRNPVFLSELHEELDQLDNVDMDHIANTIDDSCTKIDADPVSFNDLLEGLSQLVVTSAVEVTRIIEAIHSEILLRPFGRFNERNLNRWQRGMTRQAYNLLRLSVQFTGNRITNTGSKYYKQGLPQLNKPLPDSLKLFVNVLNGMMGDHLVRLNNPLAVPMGIYDRYGQPQTHEICGRVVILCHGLCLSYLSWHPCQEDSLGESIAYAQPKDTVLYLDYNTGRRISENGHCMASLLQDLVSQNPNITQIDLVGYSMGGLVARSAMFYAGQKGMNWYERVGNLITIGTPHHGAVLERISSHVLDIIRKVPFAGSLSRMGNIRSAGIVDLRHGSVRDEDWKSLNKRDVLPDHFRHPAKLPRHIKAFFIAGNIVGNLYESKTTNLVGDGLVAVESALGENTPEHTLIVPEGHKAVFFEVNHINLQYDPRVHRQVVEWLSDNGRTDYSMNLRIQSYPDEGYEVALAV